MPILVLGHGLAHRLEGLQDVFLELPDPCLAVGLAKDLGSSRQPLDSPNQRIGYQFAAKGGRPS
jgi:hypothetical protein